MSKTSKFNAKPDTWALPCYYSNWLQNLPNDVQIKSWEQARVQWVPYTADGRWNREVNTCSVDHEDFLQSHLWSSIVFTAVTNSGGTAATALSSESPNRNSIYNRTRMWKCTLSITTAGTSRSWIQTGNTGNYRFFTNTPFMMWAEWSVTSWWQIDTSTDNVFQAVWFLSSVASATTASWVYHRAPYIWESSFLKYCVRFGTAETFIWDTTIPYDSTAGNYIRTWIYWTGTDMIYGATDGTNTSINTISGFLFTYALWAVNFLRWITNSRQSNITPVVRQITVDKVFRMINPNFTN